MGKGHAQVPLEHECWKRTVGLLAERRGLERKNCDARVLLGLDTRSDRRQGSITVFQEAEHWWQLIVPSIIGGTFFVIVAFVTNTIASQDGGDFSTDEILAELTGEKPTTKAPAGQQGRASSCPRSSCRSC